jgi:hypothetical protein
MDMDGDSVVPVLLLGGLIGFVLQYFVIRAAVYNALVMFVKAAASESTGPSDVPARFDKVAGRIADVARSRTRS